MVTYELIKKLETLPFFNDLLTSGIIPMNMIDYKVIFEFYNQELCQLSKSKYNKNVKSQAQFNTATEYNISEKTVRNVVKKMKS
jgi:hypothetical protein